MIVLLIIIKNKAQAEISSFPISEDFHTRGGLSLH